MKSLLFVIPAALLVVSPALAGGSADPTDRVCCGSGLRGYAIPVQPRAAVPVCRNVRERVETRKGHFVVRTHQVCA